MLRYTFVCAAAITFISTTAGTTAAQARRAYMELRTYTLESEEDEAIVDRYLKDAFVPAINRMGAGPVGVFSETQSEGRPHIYVVTAFNEIEQFATLRRTLAGDADYARAAEPYLSVPKQNPAYARFETRLLYAFETMPTVVVPPLAKGNQQRILELRTYESHSEEFARRKIEMFNTGEIDIFRDCGIAPVFFGQTLAGDVMPNLAYMMCYEDQADYDRAWAKFRTHPEWQKLKSVEKYKGAVSNITKVMLKPRPYSQL